MAYLNFSPPVPVYVASGKSLTVSNIITLAALADSLTFTLPGSSTTLAGLSINQTFTQPQAVTASPTTGYIFAVTSTTLTSGQGLLISSYVQGGQLLYMNDNNNPNANGGVALLMQMGNGVGVFSGAFLQMYHGSLVAGNLKFSVAQDGSVIIAGSLTVGTGNGGYTSGGALILGLESLGTTTAVATLGRIPTAKTTSAQSAWATGTNNGNAYRWPVWLDT
jgi:hypothetical protein